MEFSHYSVMLPQCMEGLNIKPDGIYIDGTAGGAGHSRAIAERLTTGQLLSFDRDPDAVAEATKRLAPYPQRSSTASSPASPRCWPKRASRA